jgi:hypothetical protein
MAPGHHGTSLIGVAIEISGMSPRFRGSAL